jgi:hypothetical protein
MLEDAAEDGPSLLTANRDFVATLRTKKYQIIYGGFGGTHDPVHARNEAVRVESVAFHAELRMTTSPVRCREQICTPRRKSRSVTRRKTHGGHRSCLNELCGIRRPDLTRLDQAEENSASHGQQQGRGIDLWISTYRDINGKFRKWLPARHHI